MMSILQKDINSLTAKEFELKWKMLKFDMGVLNLQKESKANLIKIMKLYREWIGGKNNG